MFGLQLAANLLWSPLFFAAHATEAALALLVGIFFLALGTTLLFARVRRAAAWMLVPYLAWLCYAAVLNLRIVQLN
jgi:tryptophan-rich sensory protein